MIRKLSWKKGKWSSFAMKTKMIVSLAVIVAIFSAASSYQLYMQNEIAIQESIQDEQSAKQLLALKLKLEAQELALVHAGLVVSKNASAAEQYGTIKRQFEEDVVRIGETASTSDERKWKARLDNVSREFTAAFDESLATLKTQAANGASLNQQLEQQYIQSQTHKQYIFELADQFGVSYSEKAEQAFNHSEQLFAETKTSAIAAISIALLLAVSIAVLLIRSFLVPIRRMQHAMSAIGEGDLRRRIHSPARDELGKLSYSFDCMMDNVSGMLVRLREVGVELNGRSTGFRTFAQSTAEANAGILQAIGEIASGADQQAAIAEKSAALVTELGHDVTDIARSADEMKRLGEQTDGQAKAGALSVAELRDAAEYADGMLQRADQAVQSFVQDAENISGIVQTISEIASQTNVLSLNASIEAARAGQYGKGFLVIADEVRQLAEQSKSSAKSVAVMIDSLQSQMTEVRGHMKVALSAAQLQSSKLGDTLASFQTIQSSIQAWGEQADIIHEKVKRTAAGNETLIDTIQQVAAIAEETAAGAQQVNSASIEQDGSVGQIAAQAGTVHTLAETLFAEIGKFKTPELDAERVMRI